MKVVLISACLDARPELIARLILRLCFTNKILFWLVFLLVGVAVFSIPVAAQSGNPAAYTWSTFAGQASSGSADGVGTAAQFNYPDCTAVDGAGNVYVADTFNHTIRKINPSAVVTTFAGFAGNPGSGDGIGGAARFVLPQGVAVGISNTIYVADTGNNTIRVVTSAGVASTLAGQAGVSGTNDGTGNGARFNKPERLAADTSGNVYVADTGSFTIREITPGGVVSTIAGLAGHSGTNDGVGGSARFFAPEGIAVDSAGNLYVADTSNETIRMLTPMGTNWTVSTIAGVPGGYGMVNGSGTIARFYNPRGIAVSATSNLFVTDSGNELIRELTLTGTNWTVSTFAGRYGSYGNVGGTGTNAVFDDPSGVSVDQQGNLYLADVLFNTVRSVTSAAVVDNVAGAAHSNGYADGTGSEARFAFPYGLALDSARNIYVADTYSQVIRKISSAGLVTTLAGQLQNPGINDGAGSLAQFYYPKGVAVDTSRNVYVADTANNTIRMVTPAGVVSTIAGVPLVPGSNDGLGNSAHFQGPRSVAVDANGNVYVADSANHIIREITPAGTNWMVSTLAGQSMVRGAKDGVGTNAQFSLPTGIAVDGSGNLYVADSQNSIIRKLTLVGTNWAVTTIAGLAGIQGVADGTNSDARFYDPFAVAVDSSGSVYVGDDVGQVIRKLVLVGTNWVVSTIGGQAGVQGSSDAAGGAALFSYPAELAVDNAGNVFVADTGNNTIREGVFTAYGAANPAVSAQTQTNGQIKMTLVPPQAAGQWRFPWELGWHNSGETVSNLAVPGTYPVEFIKPPGWLAIPLSGPVILDNNTNVVSLTNTYYPTIGAGDTNAAPGSLTVNLGPAPPAGAGWFFLGQNTTNASGSSTNLLPGTYLVGFAQVSGRVTPPNFSVTINPGQAVTLSVNYSLSATPSSSAELPFPVPPGLVSDESTNPFGYSGQLESDVGYGSGVAVATNVVLTAAHLVFNDQKLSYVNEVYWFNQREAGIFTPCPQPARGWYVLSSYSSGVTNSYAAQRISDLANGYSPDQSTAPSRNLDVAALYFQSAVANGGYAGYLPSDAVPNTWLTSTALKMLVGYPVDGSGLGASVAAGQMYQTQPQPFQLALDPSPVLGQQQEVYDASWFLSYPGNSGGALYVQLNGTYYPAGVYLGTLYSGNTPYASAVRAIDSAVVNLITNAAALGDSGTNNGGGGVVTLVAGQASTSNPAYVQVLLGPPAVVQAGAGWRLQGDTTYSSGTNYIRAVTTTNATLEFKSITGWNPPASPPIQLTPGVLTTTNLFYTVLPPVMVANPTVGIGITGTTGSTFIIEYSTNLTVGVWLPLQTNTLGAGTNILLSPPQITKLPAVFYRAQWLP